MLKILSDFHHQDLLYSLQLVLEKRLGHEFYTQIGLDWYPDYWAIYNSPDTAKQYLLDGYIPSDKTPPLTQISRLENGTHIIKDLHNNAEHKAITLEQFKEMKFDVLICSIPQHTKIFKELRDKFQPQAKLIFQMGNMFGEIYDVLQIIPNLMASTIEFPTNAHSVFYHQEFDLNIFKPSIQILDPDENRIVYLNTNKEIVSFINILSRNAGYEDYLNLRIRLPDYQFKSYGAQTEDGVIDTTSQMAGIMKKSAWGFHVKYGGDGFGHVLYNWFACGRPVITRLSDYRGKLGEELMIDGETIIDLDKTDLDSICYKIATIPPHEYEYMTSRVREIFREKVNFEEDANKIRGFLNNLR